MPADPKSHDTKGHEAKAHDAKLHESKPHKPATHELRRRVYEILERGTPGDTASLAVDRLIIGLIIINLTAVALESLPALGERYAWLFELIEWVSLVVFTIEYGLRLWAAVEHTPFRRHSALAARWHYAISAPGLVDLVAVLPFWLTLLLPPDWRFLLVLRMVRFLKVARYSPAMRSLLDVLYGERRALFGCFVILCGITLLAAAVMHLAEGRVQPEKLGTIPDAMWWAIVTLGTIGYGDVVPVTLLGKVVAGVAELASAHATPAVALAGQVLIGRREAMAMGLAGSYAVADKHADLAPVMADPVGTLADRAERVAATWSPRR